MELQSLRRARLALLMFQRASITSSFAGIGPRVSTSRSAMALRRSECASIRSRNIGGGPGTGEFGKAEDMGTLSQKGIREGRPIVLAVPKLNRPAACRELFVK